MIGQWKRPLIADWLADGASSVSRPQKLGEDGMSQQWMGYVKWSMTERGGMGWINDRERMGWDGMGQWQRERMGWDGSMTERGWDVMDQWEREREVDGQIERGGWTDRERWMDR
jgi:hypothetical protein